MHIGGIFIISNTFEVDYVIIILNLKEINHILQFNVNIKNMQKSVITSKPKNVSL